MSTHDSPSSTELDVLPFDFEGIPVRVVTLGGQPWWVASDVARVLGYETTARITRLLDDDMKGDHTVVTPGGPQQMQVVTKGAVFRLIMRSRKGAAKRFERMVVDVILPTIAETGRYVVPGVGNALSPAVPSHVEALRGWADALEQAQAAEVERAAAASERDAARAEVAELAPAAAAWHGLADGDTTGVAMRVASKELRAAGARIGDRELPAYMAGKGLIYRLGGVGSWVAMKTAEDKGLVTMKRSTGSHRSSDGAMAANDPSVRVLARGLEFLLDVLVRERGSTRQVDGQTSLQLVVSR